MPQTYYLDPPVLSVCEDQGYAGENGKSYAIVFIKKAPFRSMQGIGLALRTTKGAQMKRSLSHTVWECKYHIVWVPKRRRKVIYGKLRKELRTILQKSSPPARPVVMTFQGVRVSPSLTQRVFEPSLRLGTYNCTHDCLHCSFNT